MFKIKTKKLLKVTLAVTLAVFVFANFEQVQTVAMGEKVAYANTITVDPGVGCPIGYTNRNPADLGSEGTCTLIAPNAQVSDFAKGLLTFETFLNQMLMPILMMIGGLLDNNFFFGSGMEERMREIWVPMRNLVNILFVIVLVGIALYNILGIGEEGSNYSLKAMLPKIIIGIIAINFSFLIIKVSLDAVTAMTNSIFALPDNVSSATRVVLDPNSENDELVRERLCAMIQSKSIAELENKTPNELGEEARLRAWRREAHKKNLQVPTNATLQDIQQLIASSLEGGENNPEYNAIQVRVGDTEASQLCNGTDLTVSGQIFFSSFGSHNAALALAVNMSKIIFYSDLPDPEKIGDVEKLTISIIFSIVLYLVYLISFIALFIVLLARTVVLWIGIVLSPILLLAIAVPVVKEKLGFLNDLLDKMIQSAIAPITIGLALTIGWIMLQAMQSVDTLGAGTSVIIWKALDGGGLPVSRLSTPQDLIVAIGTVGVVWLGVFGAASKTIAGPVTDAIKSGVGRAAGFVATAPFKYTPFIPISINGKDGNVSINDVSRFSQNLGYRKQTPGEQLLNEAVGIGRVSNPSDIRNAVDVGDFKGFISGLDSMRGNNKAIQDQKLQQAMLEAARKFNAELDSPALVKAMQNFSNTSDAKARTRIFNQEILGNTKFQEHLRSNQSKGSEEQKPADGAGDQTPKDNTPPPPPPPPKKVPKSDGNARTALNVTPAEIKTQLETMAKKVDTDPYTEADLKPILAIAIAKHTSDDGTTFQGGAINEQELRSLIGDTQLARLKRDLPKQNNITETEVANNFDEVLRAIQIRQNLIDKSTPSAAKP